MSYTSRRAVSRISGLFCVAFIVLGECDVVGGTHIARADTSKHSSMMTSMNRRASLVVVWLLADAGSCVAASPWDGTWTFDPLRSHLKPGQLTIERSGSGYRWGGASGYYAPCNRVPSPGPDGFAIACRETPLEVTTTLLEHGRPFSTTVYKLRGGGNALQVTTEYMHGQQPHSIQRDQYIRKAGTDSGLAGIWRGTHTSCEDP